MSLDYNAKFNFLRAGHISEKNCWMRIESVLHIV